MDPLGRFQGRQAADGVAGAEEAMGRGGHDGRRQRWHPFSQGILPGIFRQLPVEEGYPIAQPAPVSKKKDCYVLLIFENRTGLAFRGEKNLPSSRGNVVVGRVNSCCHASL